MNFDFNIFIYKLVTINLFFSLFLILGSLFFLHLKPQTSNLKPHTSHLTPHTYSLYPLVLFFSFGNAQNSVAREWNKMPLTAIRNDLARPIVNARNLFHTSLLMYDAWAIFEPTAESVFLGKDFGNFDCPFDGIDTPSNINEASREVMSYAVFRLLNHRFQNSFNSTFCCQSLKA